MIEFLKQMWEQIPILIKLKETCDQIEESLPYLKDLAMIGTIIGIPAFLTNLSKIIPKIERWMRTRR